MTRAEAITKARREVKIAKFERRCRCTTEGNRTKKAYKVPGTAEAGQHAMLRQRVMDMADKYTDTE